MFTVEEILEKASEYQRSRISLAELDSWFEDNWEDDAALADHPALASARAAVDGALAQYYFDHIGETAFRKELAAALRPFACIAALPARMVSSSTGTVVEFQRKRRNPAPVWGLIAASAALAVFLSSEASPAPRHAPSLNLNLAVRTPL